MPRGVPQAEQPGDWGGIRSEQPQGESRGGIRSQQPQGEWGGIRSEQPQGESHGGIRSRMKQDEERMKDYLKEDEEIEQEGGTYGGLM